MKATIALLAACLALPLAAQPTLIDQGRAAITRRDFDAAVDLLEKAVEQTPTSAEAHFWLGGAYGRKAQGASMFSAPGLAGKSKEHLERAVALNPNYIDARMGLVELYALLPGILGGSFDKALDQAKEIKQRDSLVGHRAYGFIYTTQKKPDLARKEYLDAVSEQPNSPKAHNSLGQYLASAEKNYKAAFDEFETAIKLDSNYMPALYQLGRAAGLSGANLARGEETLKKYLGYTPKDNEPSLAGAHYWLGAVYEKQGRKAEAKRSYEAALKLDPGMKQAEEALKRVS
jgi:tetratricopeptide (TPR) repeat protein